MKTRAITDNTPVVQRPGRRCIEAVLPWLILWSLSGCAGSQTAPARQGDGRTEVEKSVQEVEQSEKNNRAALAEMQRRLAAQEAEMRQLRGNLEVVQHENQTIKEQVKERSVAESDVGLPGFPQMEQTIPVAPVQPVQPGAAPARPGMPPPVGAAVALPATPAAIPAAPPAAPPAVQHAPPPPAAGKPGTAAVASKVGVTPPAKPGAAAAPPATPQQMYDAAFLLLKNAQYNASREGFEQFLEKFPNDTLADNAQYWIGELYSVQKQYREALVAFNQVLTRWPTSAKVPPSLLKIGYAFYELGDMAHARASLTKLITDYPDSSAVAMARRRLQDIAQKEKEPAKGAAGANEGGADQAAPVKTEVKSDPPGSKRIKRLAGE